MQFIVKFLGTILIFTLPTIAISQSLYLSEHDKHSTFFNRLEVKLQTDSLLNLGTAGPMSRRTAVTIAESVLNNPELSSSLTPIDRYDLENVLLNNTEWVAGDKSRFASRRPLGNFIYRNRANFLEVDQPDFYLAINPVLQLNFGRQADNDQLLFLNARGVSVRGMIAKRLGFYTYLAENLERAPVFAQQRVKEYRAIPGAGRFNYFKTTGWDFSDARGGITFNAARYINFQFAYDRNFIGNGYRSLFLSDFGSNYLFLKVNTRIWKLNYQNLFMELNPQFPQSVRDTDALLVKKYAAMHHLSVNVTRWLNLGLFEAVLFGRENHFDFMYLNPIIFLRNIETQNNSRDNAFVGFDFKANILKKAQLYGQLTFDELRIKEITSSKGWWGNKFGVQLGAKYVDAFNINNLDLQAEVNMVRPFTYSFEDSTASYGHYNQHLAHPLGANFQEFVGIARYQPLPRLTTMARLIFWRQGVDTGSANNGSNIFKLYTTRTIEYGVKVPNGPIATGLNAFLLASYELKENLFIDGSMLIRNWKTANNLVPSTQTNVISAGVRWNMARREADY